MLQHPCLSRTIPLALNFSSCGCWDSSLASTSLLLHPASSSQPQTACSQDPLPSPSPLIHTLPLTPALLTTCYSTSPAPRALPSCKSRYQYPQEPLGSTRFHLNLSAFPRPLSSVMPHPLSSCLSQSPLTLPPCHNHIPPAPHPTSTPSSQHYASSLWNLSSRFHCHENSLCSQAHLQGQIPIKSLPRIHRVAKESDMTEQLNNRSKLGFCLSEYSIHHSLISF